MSASKLRSTHYYSPLKVESDQKDVMIAQLKEEAFHLKKNQEEYYLLNDQYRQLDHRFRLIADQKALMEVDFKDRHQIALKNIFTMRADLDSLKAQLRERTLELDDFQTDSSTLRNQIDQRLIEIQKLQNQLRSLGTDAAELQGQRQRLQDAVAEVRAHNQKYLSKIRNLQMEMDRVLRTTEEQEKYFQKLKVQENILKDKILSYENQNNNLDQQINRIMDDLAAIDRAIDDAQISIKSLQGDIASTAALSDKFKSESLFNHKSTQNEVMNNNNLVRVLGNAENTLKIRLNQVQNGRRQIGMLNEENNNVQRANSKLEDEVQFCRKHLENLSLLNSELVINLTKYSQEDEIVRNLIDRKRRVILCQQKVQDLNSTLQRNVLRESPSKMYY